MFKGESFQRDSIALEESQLMCAGNLIINYTLKVEVNMEEGYLLDL